MTITLRASNSSMDDGSAATIDLSLTTSEADLVALFLKYEGASTTVTAADATAGGNAATGATQLDHANGDLHGRWLYFLSSVGGSRTYRVTLAAARPFKRLHGWAFSTDVGIWAFDTEGNGQGSSTAVASGAMTTSAADAVVLGSYGEYSPGTLSNPRVNGVAADGSIINVPVNSLAATWYKILTATMSGGQATGTLSGSGDWIDLGIAFKVAGGGGGGPTITYPMLERGTRGLVRGVVPGLRR